MESPSEDQQQGPGVITTDPNETVLTAFPYRPHSSLLDFLKGEPKVLGALQILLALIMVGLGLILIFNYINFSHNFPLVILIGYPFWGALIFLLAGYLTVTSTKSKLLGKSVTTMNVLSALVAIAGITLIIISFTQQWEICKQPSLEGICGMGRTLLLGILSIVLIITIAELSISVTVASFRCKCWTNSDEVVFLLPSSGIQNSEQAAPEENAQFQFELQEKSPRDDTTSNLQAVFFGGYAFFKLKVSRSTLVPPDGSQTGNKGRESYQTTSLLVPDEQKSILPPFQSPEEETEPKPLPPILEPRPSNIHYSQQDSVTTQGNDEDLPDTSYYSQQSYITDQMVDEDLQPAIPDASEPQDKMPQDQASSLQVLPTPSEQRLQALLPEDLTSQTVIQPLPTQALQSKPPASHIIESYDLTSEDLPYQDILSQDTPSEDSPSQDTPCQDILVHNVESQETLSQDIPTQDTLLQDVLSEGLQSQNDQPQSWQPSEITYQDIRTEVMELTQDWKSVGQSSSRRSSRRFSLGFQLKGQQPPRRYSLDLTGKSVQFPRRKSLDQQIKSWLFPKKESTNTQEKYTQTSEHFPDQHSKEEESPKQQSQDVQREEQQAKEREDVEQQADQGTEDAKEQLLKEQIQDQQAEDLQAPEENPPSGQSAHWQDERQQAQVRETPRNLCKAWDSQSQESQDIQIPENTYPHWVSANWQSQDWKSQGWRNKDWTTQEWQFEMQPSGRDWAYQELLEREALRQKTLYQETPKTTIQPKQLTQSERFIFQVGHGEDKDQECFQTTVLRDNMYEHGMQTTDNQPEGTEGTCQQSSDQQLEGMKPDDQPSSCQSLLPHTELPCLLNGGSEQEVQQKDSGCSNSEKEVNTTSSSSYQGDRQPSEEFD